MSGPVPTPVEILEARGSWRARSRTGTVRFDSRRPTCPGCLKGEARAEWNRQIKQVEKAGILQTVDRALLAAYCATWGELVELLDAKPEPEAENAWRWGVAVDRTQKRLIQLAAQFGFSPAARARVQAGQPAAAEEDGGILSFARKRSSS